MLTTSTTAVVLDSTADLPDARERFANFRIVPLLVRFPGSEELRDYIDLQPPEFYERLAAAPSPPRTSQPSPEQFASTYAELLAEGYEHIVSLHISGKLSGTLGSARLAAAEWPSQVTVLDTQLASVGIAMCALRVQGMLAEGTTIEAVTAYVEGFAARVRLVFSVDTLEYLVRGGRIGKAQGMVGSLLSVKPILECKDGEVHGVGRARGRSRVVPALEAELVQGSPADAPLRVGLAHSAAPQLLEAVAQMVARVRPAATVELATTLGAVIGTYTGPGTIGLMWLQEDPAGPAVRVSP